LLRHYRTDPRGGLASTAASIAAVGIVSHRRPVSTRPVCHGRDRERLENPVHRGQYAAIQPFFSATYAGRMGINIGDLSTVRFASRADPEARQLPAADRPRRRRMQCPGRHHRPATPPRPLLLREPRAMLARSASAHRGCYLDAAAILRRQLLAFPWIAGAERHRLPALPPPAQTRPDAVEKGATQRTSRTLPLHLAAVVARPIRASLLERFAAFPTSWLTPPQELQLHHSLPGEAREAPYASELIQRFLRN